ncbi:HNH endonuclease [Pseudomonas syringae group genomosp. 3]|uniref:HNH endonuclease n=1 Tax=Pseudomonas syringae group genomosp. 3 TaxID=251701 RepID=UPI0006B8E8B0|nr:HNH endonuclease [Pseudomonas syringae group genomosp. 3]
MTYQIYRADIDVDALRSRLHYDAITGLFCWIEKPSIGVSIGDEAGFITSAGYRSIRVFGSSYLAHRLAWLHHYGEWPTGDLDHINGIKSDNRIENLRDVSRSENCQNIRSAQCNNAVGLLGVSLPKKGKRWVAQIHHNGKKRTIGYFSTPELAHEAYLSEKRKNHPGCTI